ncbi:hypothetical protein K458DRAFT_421726 [Lentithecium fluviatile CBS 122367]|uniref:MINDY deubiquitinase domain-containing protein n=1 Tax=Lentithecium fluviatile CBS 122367 TaxID=1168545 RepID=A0A6G1IPL0_9PLEO|nr:hypothetical protein K458DRAFT_421726 [Lentithecium fluviatile CBS 122367]
MVLRKNTPSNDLVPAPLSKAMNNPPYPTTPADERPPQLPAPSPPDVYSLDLTTSPAFNLKPVEEAQKNKADDSESDYSDNEWDQSDDDTRPNDLPGVLKIGGGKPIPAPANKNALPDALRAGPPPGVAVRKSLEAISPEPTGTTSSSYGAASNVSSGSIPLHTNNPYLKMQTTGQSNFGGESSQQIWGDTPSQAPTYGELVELPGVQTPHTPTNHKADFGTDSTAPPPQRTNSFDQPPLIAVESATPQSAHPRHDSNASEDYTPGMDISSLDAFARTYGLPEDQREGVAPKRTWQDQQAWEKSERERKQRELDAAHEAALKAEQERHHEEEFHRMEQSSQFPQPASQIPPQAPQHQAPPVPFQAPPVHDEQAPALPPRRSHEEHAPPMPPRPLDTGIVGSSNLGPESPNTAMNRQRKEHYQIKHIRWHDVSKRGIRTSPILTQNLNGPCPLLALVNALVLSTPAGMETALVETLRTREQVSLGLLLDAVFDELMSGRRGGAAQELPDVSELYKFLLALHTGLNVNPMFVQDADSTDGTSAHGSLLGDRPGGFENTRDMRLYRTFDIPLMHGWLPEPGSDAYRSLERIAKSYELSQYVQFQEEELDAKLQTGDALTTDEQQMFTDIHAIKEFLNRWPTQLTNYGLRTMRESLQLGQVAILFRNDHFSTLYKDPRTEKLVTLVTDQGYSSHDEIVWESLVDVNGQGSEHFSGDFRPVGHNAPPQREPPIRSLLDVDDNEGWTTVHSRRGNQHSSLSGLTPAPSGLDPSVQPQSPGSDLGKVEQEDHDLALALQLQEEEDDRHRRSVEERRRRENELSENAIAARSQTRPANDRTSRPGEQLPPLIPPRRNNQQTHRPSNEPAPPPTYEEASTSRPYHPPQGHPANPQAPLQPQGSAYQMNTHNAPQIQGLMQGGRRSSRPMMQAPLPARPGRRQSAGMVGPNQQEEREKCVVM